MKIENYGSFPKNLPIVVEDEAFLYPFMIAPLFLSEEQNKAAEVAMGTDDRLVFITAKKENENDENDFYDVGVIGVIMRRVGLPDGRVKILFQGICRGEVVNITSKAPLCANVRPIISKEYDPSRIEAILAILKERLRQLHEISHGFPTDLLKSISETMDPNRAADLICSAARLKKEQAYKVFKENDPEERLLHLVEFVVEEIKAQQLQREIKSKASSHMERTNKEYFLREQMRQIKKELGLDDKDSELAEYQKKLESMRAQMPKEAYKEIEKQIKKLGRMHPDSADANLLQNYIELVLEIPFGKVSNKKLNISDVSAQLNKDHFALEKPKERIVEYFAVHELAQMRKNSENAENIADSNSSENTKATKADSIKSPKSRTKKADIESKNIESKSNGAKNKDLNKTQKDSIKTIGNADLHDAKATILCFYGPPGVGKTSLANSIATALGRKLVRIALGGLEDVNELRGHRRTYIGAMPGRIISGLIDAEQMDPVIVLDEIDKLHASYRGDPASVLLEILDPEQNSEFRDYYANFDVDLSKAIFIATANDISNIPAPLRDRMEFIALNSYTPEQKEQIAKKYLIPQELKKHNLNASEITFAPNALKEIIEKYTREAGVRGLRRRIAQILRKCAKEILLHSVEKDSIESKSAKATKAPATSKSRAKNIESKNIESKSAQNTAGAKSAKGAQNSAKIQITAQNLKKYLDKIIFEFDEIEKTPQIGLINGLAWTAVGGDVLKIEALKIRGKGGLSLTGNLGEVMKESAQIAYSVVRELISSGNLKVDLKQIELSQKEIKEGQKPQNSDIYSRFELHLHVPEGATPKDGPSAGIAMGCAIASVFSNKPARADIAMTGELSLRGKVLPIGGLQEKLIAAFKAGIKEVLIPQKNYERDLDEISDEVKKGLKITPVSNFTEVLKKVFSK